MNELFPKATILAECRGDLIDVKISGDHIDIKGHLPHAEVRSLLLAALGEPRFGFIKCELTMYLAPFGQNTDKS